MTSTGYETFGRSRQKQRTRDALVAAARQLIASGSPPTVEAAAAEAGISRTTAYRYFANQRALLVAAHPEIEATSLLADDASEEPAARLEHVLDAFTALIAETEVQQRAMLRLSLEPHDASEMPLRQGRAIGWFRDALQPHEGELSVDQLRRLVLALRSATGIEARVWLVDVAGLSGEEATELLLWTGRAIYRAALGTADRSPPEHGR